MRIKIVVALLLLTLCVSAQGVYDLTSRAFFNLTAQEVKIDSVLPVFSYDFPLPPGYSDSIYTVTIDYPEFIDMSPTDIARLQKIVGAPAADTLAPRTLHPSPFTHR